MKKITLLSAILLFIVSTVFAQSTALPIDASTKLVTYSGVIDVKGAAKEELYKRGLAWFNSYFKNPASVFRKQDVENGEISGVYAFKVQKTDKAGVKSAGPEVGYTVTIFCKADKYKYEITKLNQKGASYYGIERWMNKSDKAYRPEQDSYLPQVDSQVNTIIESI